MARLLPLLVVFLVGLFFMLLFRRPPQGPANDQVFRPRARSPSSAQAGATSASTDAAWVVRRSDLQDVRDGYSSATIDPEAVLWGCTRCQAAYHDSSKNELMAHNGGKCALCGTPGLRRLKVI